MADGFACACLIDKDTAAAWAYADQIAEEKRASRGWYPYFEEFAATLGQLP